MKTPEQIQLLDHFGPLVLQFSSKWSEEIIMTPNCTCQSPDVIKNQAGGNEFYYCRGCKTEVVEKPSSTGIDLDNDSMWDADSNPFITGSPIRYHKLVVRNNDIVCDICDKSQYDINRGSFPAECSGSTTPSPQLQPHRFSIRSVTGVSDCVDCGIEEAYANAFGMVTCRPPTGTLPSLKDAADALDKMVKDLANDALDAYRHSLVNAPSPNSNTIKPHSIVRIPPSTHRWCRNCGITEEDCLKYPGCKY